VNQFRAVEAATQTVETYEVFFEREYRALVRFAYLLCGDAAEAEEIAEEAMARVYERWDRVGWMGSPGGYANRVALNLYRRRFRIPSRLRQMGGGSASRDPLDDVVTRSDVAAALEALPVGQRAAVLLVEWMGLDSSEAAKVLGVRPASVRSRVHRAKETLRRRLEVEDA
jgi:RNA polymerase sigma factor (sigma-70 family)